MLDKFITFPQFLGILAFILGVICFYQRNDRKLKIVMLIQNITYMSHFILLDAKVAALSSLLSTLRTATSIYISSKYIALGFVIVGIIFGYVIADSVWQVFPIIASTIGTISLFLLKGIPMRLFMLVGSACWLTNNILVGSLGGVLLESTVMFVNTITIIRLMRQTHR
ncbi:YgjV family protein [Avibacterium paragallinarum]|uniref:YgjV family protein n=1 Tax=Avibacterium paragallinarum TaxID=728 RepID=A0AAE5WHN4_AVIPA|nr:YgjV family protein [Avibacterium paragallinarum]MEE3607948.1 YgjV family protein [Avibacterium paragallinarum]MEE3620939.1 YgjV family protein [Avibacterium paragallinarum]MEE3668002.1 YgjV family protein [Avibacterium paragallinarum]MEE3679792.1 YgjV family protein [Avibacterium paragallinarum]MEE4385058.1 YgjV family protein [Avibacterium paragallinarum]